ncbi:MAG: YqgE/AlgH family protein [Betaproteobacteria bacterium]|nr:YqgE/AlgH family protein [Betaproteobacteria bacterium]
MNKTRPVHAFAVLAALLLGLLAAPLHAQGDARPVMLVAKPHLRAAYSQTVLVVVPFGDGEHLGFIINRPLELSLGSVFPEHAPSRKVIDPVHFGGPVMVDTMFAVLRSPRSPGRESLPLFADLFVASRANDIDRIIEQTPEDARFFIGFVGWRAGELDAEIAKGFWYVLEPQAELVFRKDSGGLWRELVRGLGIEPGNPGARAL